MNKVRLKWFPPAEAALPFKSLLPFILARPTAQPAKTDISVGDYTSNLPGIYAYSARALLFNLLQALLKKNPGRTEVLLPGYTCYSVAAAVVKSGLTLRVYDLDPDSMDPDPDSIRHATSEKTLAIISQHLFGMPSYLSEIAAIANQYGAYHIEDAAQALGGKIDGTYLGTSGDFGLYSFGRGKPLPIGCGGYLVIHTERQQNTLSEKPESLERYHAAISAVTRIMSHPSLYGLAECLPVGLGQTVFEPNFPDRSIPSTVRRMIENNIVDLDRLNSHRRRIAAIYHKAFSESNMRTFPQRGIGVYTRFPLIDTKICDWRALRHLGLRRMYPKMLLDEPAIRCHIRTTPKDKKTFGARTIAQTLITLPTHSGITARHAMAIASAVNTNHSKNPREANCYF